MSRADYGVYHLILNFVEGAVILLPAAAEAHQKLVWLVNAGQTGDAIDLAKLFSSLRLMRNCADYDLKDIRFRKPAFVRTQIIAAQDALTTLAACNAEPARSEIHAKMRAYAQNTLRLTVTNTNGEGITAASVELAVVAGTISYDQNLILPDKHPCDDGHSSTLAEQHI